MILRIGNHSEWFTLNQFEIEINAFVPTICVCFSFQLIELNSVPHLMGLNPIRMGILIDRRLKGVTENSKHCRISFFSDSNLAEIGRLEGANSSKLRHNFCNSTRRQIKRIAEETKIKLHLKPNENAQ